MSINPWPEKVFVVTSGCYSDYGIDAVFFAEDEADRYVEIQHQIGYPKNDEAGYGSRVEEWPVGCEEVDKGYTVRETWGGYIIVETGEISLWPESRMTWAHPTARGETTEPFYRRGWGEIPAKTEIQVRSYVSKDHANKLAVEARQNYLRKQADA